MFKLLFNYKWISVIIKNTVENLKKCTHDNAKKWFYRQNKKLKCAKDAEFYLESDGHNQIINLWARIQVLM